MAKTRMDHGEQRRCPIDFALDVFGDRWTLLVIRDLAFVGKRHFHELISSEEGIASNILTARLKKLEQHGVISRRPDPDNRRQVVYELTEKGLDLLPTIVEIVLWSAKHDPKTAAPKAVVRRMRKDRDGFIREVRAGARAAKPPAAGRRP